MQSGERWITQEKTKQAYYVIKMQSQRTDYCCELYSFNKQPDLTVLQDISSPEGGQNPLPILREEVDVAIKFLKGGNSPGIDSVLAGLLKREANGSQTSCTNCEQKYEMGNGHKNGLNH